jgi:lipopolysaccharide assembly outer membrane protein LptD (OstA)
MASSDSSGMPGRTPIIKITSFFALCLVCAAAAGESRSETFVISAERDGREATITIPVGAVSAFSADNAVALPDYADGEFEAMRLSGDVRIHVTGTAAPIQIRADRVVLKLTADETPGGRLLHSHAGRQMHSEHVIVDDDSNQTFVGDVEFTVPTASGALQIRAERLERVTGARAGRVPL